MAKIIGSIRFGIRESKSTCGCRYYVRLGSDDHEKQETDQVINIRKGYIPVLVGNEEENLERVMIPMKLIKHPCIVTLLDIAAHELGYNQPGTLRIQCQVQHFKKMLHNISKRK